MSDLQDLYREILLDHYRRPRNSGTLPTPPAVTAQGHNPLCGDKVNVFVETDGMGIDRLVFTGEGCAISQSSASMMTEVLGGVSIDEAHARVLRFKRLLDVTDGPDEADGSLADDEEAVSVLKDAIALSSVKAFPARIRCATLAWNTFELALTERSQD